MDETDGAIFKQSNNEAKFESSSKDSCSEISNDGNRDMSMINGY